MPVTLSQPVPATIPMSDLPGGSVGVVAEGEYLGYVVFWKNSSNRSLGFCCFRNESGYLLDGFLQNCPHRIRVLQSGESFTVTIP